ncbi:S-adenosylmethionine:tRNA ribosyltransferase-isomerase [Neobacillus sp. MM2021_6]|uniref:S-adenosylmethionine:tRNA ribosyltransferase-isomerase n=1 Tax=Bacillaceae TaxID=186817 RepID=UPI00140E1856|nr:MULTISPECIES: S-adenosylmethionine:tRNA ribosyltransferase-isomerase [Bacillaceae]MBO0961508.1 S-adenosylmethionine:tRNA ribosyltransferase-isomerase [Neobacillus sp. MM2021_6]NHC19866.1 S-adenosylmethionine:tRNA ribosyltransferase-isomerase [Bacillus sp. MM2020_4]
MVETNALDFYLPTELNASLPPEKRGLRRDHVRMLTLNRITGEIKHDHFFHLADYLQPGDLVILNNSRTIPAVLQAEWRRGTFKRIPAAEVRLARRRDVDIWEALIVAAPVKMGDILQFSSELAATVIGERENSPLKIIQFSKKGTDLVNIIYALGEPVRYEYIEQPWDLDSYQTVFASHPGSVEMPSAGRAFSWELLFKLKRKNIQVDFIQLHTGLSYFLDDQWPQTPEENEEEYHISERTMERIHETKARGKRVIAIGTTVVRALETAAKIGALSGMTKLYINQKFSLKIVNGIITGLHEPKASHLDMLSAFISEKYLLKAYDQAIESGYLWHEFGDMNLIL